MGQERHFVTGSFQSHRRRLSEEEMALIRDNVVRSCVDLLVVDGQGNLLLGVRRIKPQAGPYTFGSGRWPGESFSETAVRIAKDDLGLEICSLRFRKLPTNPYSQVWGRRQEPPQDHGCHDDSTVMVVELFPPEIKAIRLDQAEYTRICRAKLATVAKSRRYHKALRQFVQDLLSLSPD